MKKAFRDAYERELDVLYERSAEFAAEFPGLADRLGRGHISDADIEIDDERRFAVAGLEGGAADDSGDPFTGGAGRSGSSQVQAGPMKTDPASDFTTRPPTWP